MKLNRKHGKLAVALSAVAVATVAIAGTLMQLQPEMVVSTDAAANNAYKAKMGWQSYMNGSSTGKTVYDVKAQLLVYADGPAGEQDIWIARSINDGATWTQTNVTHNGGTSFAITDPVNSRTGTFSITHYKPNIYVAPVGVLNGGKGANALVSWTSSDCQGSAAQRINSNLVPLTGKDQPYSCLWTARSSDGGQTWTTQRLTDGGKDADNDVLGGSVKYTSDTTSSGHFAVAFQADPEGLQLGEAEGTGDGASGANVSPGTNIWYTYLSKPAFEAGTDFPLPVQVSDNNATSDGSPGASRPNLFLSGGNAILAYEETKGSGSSGKQVIYHSFSASSYPTLDGLPGGTSISDPAHNARRVRFVAQGDEALGGTNGDAAFGGTQGVHVLLLWRDTTLTTPAAASDIMVRRGIKNTALRAGSTGFRPDDVMADTAINLSDPGASSLVNNAKAHRALLRGDFAAVAYDQTTNLASADATPPTDTYNLFVHRSTDGGNTWSTARNMSRIADPSIRVAEPRMVPTPGTIKLPDGTATGEAEDVQDRNVFFVGWGTETNAADGKPRDIYITRTIDQGANYERVQLLAEGPTEQSEAQLRMPPDGKTMGAIWMQDDTVAGTKEVMYRNGGPATLTEPDPDLSLTASSATFGVTAQGQVTFTIVNQGAGNSRSVILSGTAPAGLTLVSSSDSSVCKISGSVFTCTIPEILTGASRAISLNVTSTAQGSYALPATVSGDVVETDDTNNAATANVTVYGNSGGCTTSTGTAPFDPVLPALAALGLIGMGVRRLRRS